MKRSLCRERPGNESEDEGDEGEGHGDRLAYAPIGSLTVSMTPRLATRNLRRGSTMMAIVSRNVPRMKNSGLIRVRSQQQCLEECLVMHGET